jgi:hypothetical protein
MVQTSMRAGDDKLLPKRAMDNGTRKFYRGFLPAGQGPGSFRLFVARAIAPA